MMRLRIAAESGDPKAQLALAQHLLIHDGSDNALQEALTLIRTACAQNDADALLFHALLAALGFGRAQNIQEAYDLTAQAAAAGAAKAQSQIAALSDADGALDLAPWSARPAVEQHFAAPRIYTVKNFLAPGACDWMIARGETLVKRAPVLDEKGGRRISEKRTSSTVSIHPLDNDLVAQLINLRVAGAIGLPIAHHEPINLLRYKVGQQYMPHYDFLHGPELASHAAEIKVIGQRIGTFLIYLNDGYDGGETEFPHLNWRFKGAKGDALFFWNLDRKGAPEANSLHAGLPVLSGEKWLLSKWIRVKPIPLNGDFYWNESVMKAARALD